ncbi:MAG: hypothetical protein RR048_03385 [Oscillospiraceae bacterium]
MDTMLFNKDHKVNISGNPTSVEGTKEIAQRILIRLSVPKGSFPLCASLGSLLYTLPNYAEKDRTSLAFQYVQSALIDMPQVVVKNVECRYEGEFNEIYISAVFKYENDEITVGVRV